MLSPSLRDRIRDLVRESGLLGSDPRSRENGNGAASNGRNMVPTGIEEILHGGIITTLHGTVFAHERLYSELDQHTGSLLRKLRALCDPPGWEPVSSPGEEAERIPSYVESDPSDPALWARPRRDRDLRDITGIFDPPERGLFRRFGHRRVLYLDIETCALSAAPVFLVGLCHLCEGDLVLRQLFARDYAEERALLTELGRIAGEHDFLITFNGKAFDLPFLRDRATHHRLEPLVRLPHLDLLWMARRRWKGILPDCRLKTIEWRVLRRRRAGDVGSAEIPGLYHDYVKRGEAHRLLPVFHHNMLDVVAMVELTPVLFDPDAQVY